MTELFFELIQVTLGNKERLDHQPSEEEWRILFTLANKQSLGSVLFRGLERVFSDVIFHKPSVFFQWFAVQQSAVGMNALQNKRAGELCHIVKHNGFRSCVLKGQGTALYYDNPEYRQCGDIDIWVEGDRDKILGFARQNRLHIGHVDIKHTDIKFFDDVPVEIHFLPSWMYNPFTNKRLQQFFKQKADSQFANIDEKSGFTHTTIDFDLVYSMVHIYRHIFSEGIGLRQLVDYYYILQASTENQRCNAFSVLKSLRMSSFVGGIMWILREYFGMKYEYTLCPKNKRHGEFLLSEILTGGNFGQYDTRMQHVNHEKRFLRGFVQFKKNLRFVSYYPSEVLWSPFWKLWHWYWRKKKGYL